MGVSVSDMRQDMELLAADFPGWRIEHTASGTGYFSAHRGEGDEAEHLGSPTSRGLRRLLERREGGTVADLGASIAQAGY